MASRESRCMGLTRESGSGLIDHARVKRSVSQWAGRRGRLPGEHELGRLREGNRIRIAWLRGAN